MKIRDWFANVDEEQSLLSPHPAGATETLLLKKQNKGVSGSVKRSNNREEFKPSINN